MTLRELLDGVAAAHGDVVTESAPGGEVTWSSGGRPFVVLSVDSSAAEFALEPAVAAAAARTPDVTQSGRGPGWVRFRPAVLDEHGMDRASAWFESAHRRLVRG